MMGEWAMGARRSKEVVGPGFALGEGEVLAVGVVFAPRSPLRFEVVVELGAGGVGAAEADLDGLSVFDEELEVEGDGVTAETLLSLRAHRFAFLGAEDGGAGDGEGDGAALWGEGLGAGVFGGGDGDLLGVVDFRGAAAEARFEVVVGDAGAAEEDVGVGDVDGEAAGVGVEAVGGEVVDLEGGGVAEPGFEEVGGEGGGVAGEGGGLV